MGKIVVSQNITLDGVVQDPTGEEGFGNGGWFTRTSARDREEWAKLMLAEARGAQAMLLGRRSDEWFADRWLSRTGEWADRLNSLPKFVVSSTLKEVRWSTADNSAVLAGDVVKEVSDLREELTGDLVVNASLQLVRTLMEHDLVDELRLTVYPVVLGSGERLFGETSGTRPMRLVSARAVGDNLTFLTYERDRDASALPRRGDRMNDSSAGA